MTKCRYPGCPFEDSSRPYARSGLMSVTSAISFADFGKSAAMPWAAAEIAATTAIHDYDWSHPGGDWGQCTKDHKVEPGLCKACKACRYEFRKRWDEKTAIGSHVHHLAVSWAKGEEITSDPVVDPYLDNLETFYKLYKPEWLGLERTVKHVALGGGAEYVGTFDAMAVIDCPLDHASERCVWLLDIKTSSSAHELEWALQLSAYRWATYLTRWEKGKKWEEIIEGDMPTVAHCGAIWLQPEAADPLMWVETTSEIHNRFLQLVELATWWKQQEKESK